MEKYVLKNLNIDLKEIFSQKKAQDDFKHCLGSFKIDKNFNETSMVTCNTDDGKTIVFPENIDIHVFSIIYQTDIAENSESEHIRVCVTIGKMMALHGIVDAEFGYAILYYSKNVECYSIDFLYSIY